MDNKKNKRISASPFTTCEKGHDLTSPNAFMFDGTGRRFCRQCNVTTKKKVSRTKDAFH